MSEKSKFKSLRDLSEQQLQECLEKIKAKPEHLGSVVNEHFQECFKTEPVLVLSTSQILNFLLEKSQNNIEIATTLCHLLQETPAMDYQIDNPEQFFNTLGSLFPKIISAKNLTLSLLQVTNQQALKNSTIQGKNILQFIIDNSSDLNQNTALERKIDKILTNLTSQKITLRNQDFVERILAKEASTTPFFITTKALQCALKDNLITPKSLFLILKDSIQQAQNTRQKETTRHQNIKSLLEIIEKNHSSKKTQETQEFLQKSYTLIFDKCLGSKSRSIGNSAHFFNNLWREVTQATKYKSTDEKVNHLILNLERKYLLGGFASNPFQRTITIIEREPKLAQALLKSLEQRSISCQQSLIKVKNKEGKSALDIALEQKSPGCIISLLKIVPPNVKTDIIIHIIQRKSPHLDEIIVEKLSADLSCDQQCQLLEVSIENDNPKSFCDIFAVFLNSSNKESLSKDRYLEILESAIQKPCEDVILIMLKAQHQCFLDLIKLTQEDSPILKEIFAKHNHPTQEYQHFLPEGVPSTSASLAKLKRFSSAPNLASH